MKTYPTSPARKIKPEAVVLHPHEPALVINYSIVALGTAAATTEQQQKFVRIDPHRLASYDDCVCMAGQLVDQSKYLIKSQRSEVEQLLHQLYQRHHEAVAAADQSSSSSSSTPTPHANMANLDTYLEMLYDDTHKVEGTAKILELTRDVKNLEALLLGDPTVPSALARILGDCGSRCRGVSLLYNILRIFLVASHFHEMHEAIVTEHRVGSLTMRALEGKLPDVLQSELAGGDDVGNGDGHFTQKGRTANTSHSRLFFVGLWLLLNLASGNALVEEKMVKKRLIPRFLLPFLADDENETTDPDLHILVLTFLKRLSVYKENVQQMAEGQLVPTLVKLIRVEISMPKSSSTTSNGNSRRRKSSLEDEGIIGAALGILYNLAFDPSLRQAMVVHGILPKLVGLLRCKQTWRAGCLKLLYILSFDNETKLLLGGSDGYDSSNSNAGAMPSSSVMPLLKELIFHLPHPSLTGELAALAVNLTFEASNVEQLCAKAGLRRLMDRVIRYRDPLVLKIVRNVSQWSLASQGALTDPDNEYHLRNLWPSHIKPLLALLAGSSSSNSSLPSAKPGLPALSSSLLRPPQAVVLEALGTLANLTPLDLPVGMQWHNFVVPSTLHPAQTQSEEQQQQQQQQQPPQTVWLYCREWLLALVSCLRVGTREVEEENEEEKEVVDMLLQILLLLQTLALDPVHLNDMTSDETFLEALHSLWRAYAHDEPELGLQALVLVHRILVLSLPSPISWYRPHYRHDIVRALWHANAEVRKVANRCVECFVEDGRHADEEGTETMGDSLLQQARFEAHNAEWCARMKGRERI
eukprot:evm.model.NODE_6661_length_6252_cov_34.915867.2